MSVLVFFRSYRESWYFDFIRQLSWLGSVYKFERTFYVMVSILVPFSWCLWPVFSLWLDYPIIHFLTSVVCYRVIPMNIVCGPWIRRFMKNFMLSLLPRSSLSMISTEFFFFCPLGPTTGALYASFCHTLHATVSTSGTQGFLSLRVLDTSLPCCSCRHCFCHGAERKEKK